MPSKVSSTNLSFPKSRKIALLFIISLFQISFNLPLNSTSSELPNKSKAIYRTIGIHSKCIELEKYSDLDWPGALTATFSIINIDNDTYFNFYNESDYIFDLYYGECNETFSISNQDRSTTHMFLNVKLFLGYFDNLYTEFNATIFSNETLGLITMKDKYDVASMKVNITLGSSHTLPSNWIVSAMDYPIYFPRTVNGTQECVVIIDSFKQHIIRMDYNSKMVPHFQSIKAIVKQNGVVVDGKEFTAYPTTCPDDSKVYNVSLYIKSNSETAEISWKISPMRFAEILGNSYANGSLYVKAKNVEIKSIENQNYLDSLSICSTYRPNALYVFENTLKPIRSAGIKELVYTRMTIDGSIPLESCMIKSFFTPEGHLFDRFVPQSSCVY